MNLHAIASGAISAVNPMVMLVVRVSTGYVTGDDGTQTSGYGPPQRVMGQVQPLTGGELQHMDSLSLQGDFQGIYISGQVHGLVRADNKGGDLITLEDGTAYLVTKVLEAWPDWCKVVATLQNGK